MRLRTAVLASGSALALATPGAAARSPIVQDGQARFEVITPTLIRMEYAADGRFEDRPTLTVGSRRRMAQQFTAVVSPAAVEIRTRSVTLRYTRGSGPFAAGNVTLRLRIGRETVTLNPAPGARRRALGGWRRSLDLSDGPEPLHEGVLSRDGWHLLDDSASALLTPSEPPGFAARPARRGVYQDLYLFAFGHDYPRALGDLRRLTGPAPLLPRKAFGVWFSRYWPYGERDWQDLVARFRAERVPLDTISLDTDFKNVNDPIGASIAAAVAGAPGEPYSWNGWQWNRQKFPDPARFVSWAHGEGLAVGLNVHPSINSRDPLFTATLERAGGLREDPGCRVVQADTLGQCMVFDWANARHLGAYFALHEPFERDGVDFWWLDWCCDAASGTAPGLTPDAWINQLYADRQRARGSRWPAFSRMGGSFQLGFGGNGGTGAFAEHRNTIQFTGDTCATWPLLRFASEFTAAAGSIGLPYVSHDIGTFHGVSQAGVCNATVSPILTPPLNALPGDMYARWVQLGTFQPLDRLHSHHGKRLPWEYPGKPGRVAAEFLRLREALVPYLYTLAREAHDTGLPMARALYLHWPESDAAYRFPSQYTLGRDLLVAPVAAPGDPATVKIWIPPGAWIDYFTGERLTGPREIERSVPLERMAVFARAGAILPTQPFAVTTAAAPAASLQLDAFPGRGAFTLYEDAGDGLEYLGRRFARTRITQRRGRGVVTVTIGREHGSRFTGRRTRRDYVVRIRGVSRRPGSVTVAGRRARRWSYDPRRGVVIVSTGARRTSRAQRVVVRPRVSGPRGPSGPRR